MRRRVQYMSAAIVAIGLLGTILAAVITRPTIVLASGEQPLPQTLEQLQEILKRLQAEVKNLQGKVQELAKASKRKDFKTPQAAPQAAAIEAAPKVAPWQKAIDSYKLGRQQEDSKQYKAAIEAYTRAIEFDPKSDSAYLHRGISYAQTGDHTTALSDFSQSLSLQPNNSQAYLSRAASYAALAQNAKAIQDAGEAITRNERDSDAYLLRGRLYLLEGNKEREEADFAKVVQIDPHSETVYLVRAVDLQNSGQAQRALAECDNALRANPNSTAGYLCRAESHIKLNAVQLALEDVNRAMVAGQPGNQPFAVVKDLALALAKSARPTLAPVPVQSPLPSVASPATAPAPPSARPSVAAPASAAAAMRAQPQPVSQFGSLVSASTEAQRLMETGRDLVQQNRFHEALVPLTRASELDAKWARLRNLRGYVLLRLNQYAQAKDELTEAIRLGPGLANAYVNRAVARGRLGDHQGAVEDSKKAAELIAGEPAPRNRSAALTAQR